MDSVRRIVIDVLKPYDPPLLDFTQRVTEIESVEGACSSLIELDQEVQNIQITFEGVDLDFDSIKDTIEELGGTIHSVDQVACGEYIVEDIPTLQDT